MENFYKPKQDHLNELAEIRDKIYPHQGYDIEKELLILIDLEGDKKQIKELKTCIVSQRNRIKNLVCELKEIKSNLSQYLSWADNWTLKSEKMIDHKNNDKE
jgi:hypothetical protein